MIDGTSNMQSESVFNFHWYELVSKQGSNRVGKAKIPFSFFSFFFQTVWFNLSGCTTRKPNHKTSLLSSPNEKWQSQTSDEQKLWQYSLLHPKVHF